MLDEREGRQHGKQAQRPDTVEVGRQSTIREYSSDTDFGDETRRRVTSVDNKEASTHLRTSETDRHADVEARGRTLARSYKRRAKETGHSTNATDAFELYEADRSE